MRISHKVTGLSPEGWEPMRKTFGFATLLAAGLLVSGCEGAGDLISDEGGVVVEEGKEDNFLSLKAQEYYVEGQSTIVLEESYRNASADQKLARVKKLIPLKQVVIGWFLNAYLSDKEHDQPNAQYGGFSALTKNGAYEELGIEPVDAITYKFTFRQEFGGKLDLLSRLPTQKGEDGRLYFDLKVGKISNDEMARLQTNGEWYRSAPWSSFDPAKVDASQVETQRLAVWAEPRSPDAWIDYNRLFADGKVTIGVHWGWDYHNNYHLVHSREVYDWLVARGFKSPVASYDQYARTSGPLTKTFQANGKAVVAEVSLFWGKPGTDTDPDTSAGGIQLEDDMRASFRDREVIVFSGHSGPFYGFALANWRKTDEGDLDDSKIPGLDMPKDVYQVVLAEGCDTYALGEAFRLNPNKAGAKNLDVITTTSFSNAGTAAGTQDFLTAIFGENKVHEAKTWGTVLDALEGNSYWFNTMYGVHGLDDNPHRHPYASEANLCKACQVNADCGGEAMRCTRSTAGERFCTFLCTADDGCPEGFKCMNVASGSYLASMQCVPSNQTCKVAPPKVDGPAVILNEVFASPDTGKEDANGDGAVSGVSDEFIELVNLSTAPVDLGGWTVSDSAMLRLTFPAGTTLGVGKALVVFGGGDAKKFGSLGGAVVVVATAKHLGLNNSGDKVVLKNAKGKVVDQVVYASEGGKGKSLVRERDGDPKAAWVQHPDVPQSAGLKRDGTAF